MSEAEEATNSVGEKMNQQERLAHEQGTEAGLAMALGILQDLAEVMLERERAAAPGRKANYARRTRIKAHQVAASRIETRLKRQRAILEKLETLEDRLHEEDELRAAVEHLDFELRLPPDRPHERGDTGDQRRERCQGWCIDEDHARLLA